MLATHSWGAGAPLVLAHGFTQTGAFWDGIAFELPDRRLIAPDLPGHGGSAPYADAALPQAAALLAKVGGVADYAGYSLGGRVLLHLALDRPDLVHSLVLVGARPGFPRERERAARAAADDRLADRLAQFDQHQLAAWLRDEWLAADLFRTLPPAAARLDERSRNDPRALAAALRACSTGRQAYLTPRLGELSMPVLLVHGQRDKPEIARECRAMADAIGSNARLAEVPGCGHAVPFEQPDVFAALLREFLAEHGLPIPPAA